MTMRNALRSFGTMVLLALAAALAAADEPAPTFQADSASHLGRIPQLVATPDERLLVTAGFDRTLRVWDAATGRQLQRLFLPALDDRDGKAHALAMSPDGERIAVGGDLLATDGSGAVLIVSLRNGQILRQLSGFQGPIGALAFSPDGRHLAVGFNGNRTSAIVRQGDAADIIAAALAGTRENESGIRIYDTRGWQAIFADAGVAGRIQGLGFNRHGALAASAQNPPHAGELVVYRAQGSGYVRQGARSLGANPGRDLFWSADGEAIYVGRHSIVSATDLRESTDGSRLDGILKDERIAFIKPTADGKELLTATWSPHAGDGQIRVYAGTALASAWPRSIAVPDGRINDVLSLSGGRLAYVTDAGVLAMLGPDDRFAWRVAPGGMDFRKTPERLKVSADGEWIGLVYESEKGPQEVAFHLMTGRYAPVTQIPAWREPLTSGEEVGLLSWKGTNSGTANHSHFPMRQPNERSLAVAAHSAQRAFVYGTDGGRLYKGYPQFTVSQARRGRGRSSSNEAGLFWIRQLGSDVTAVNLIESRGLVVAVTQDGSLRLLRWRDGAVVLTYYVQPRERKWVAIADTGHYEASVGGEDLGGWVVPNRDGQLPNFFPMSRLRQDYFLPGMIQRVLQFGDGVAGVNAARAERAPVAEGERVVAAAPPVDTVSPPPTTSAAATIAVEPAAAATAATPAKAVAETVEIAAPNIQRLPPTIEVLSPGFDASTEERVLQVKIRVRSPDDAPVTRIATRVVSAGQSTRGLQPKPMVDEQTLAVDLPAEDSEVQVFAENQWGSSVPVIIRVRYTGARAATQQARDVRGTLHLLAIGVSEYDNPRYKLDLAAKDARDFSQLLKGQQGKLYEKVELSVLTDKDAGKAAVESALQDLRAKVRPQDTTFVFLAGHGINDGSGDYLYLPKEVDLDRLKDTSVSFRLLRRTLASLPGRTLMFVDTCHSGNVLGGLRKGLSRDNTAAINDLASAENNIIVFASSTGEQESIEDPAWGNGAFTKALVEGLRGEADYKKRGRVTYKQLDAYVSDRVDELTKGRQTPVTPVLVTVPDFALAEVIR